MSHGGDSTACDTCGARRARDTAHTRYARGYTHRAPLRRATARGVRETGAPRVPAARQPIHIMCPTWPLLDCGTSAGRVIGAGPREVEKRCERTSGAQGQRENERCGRGAV
eukprot:scaffold30889_cov75-Phaeocystis_antarctica.AAC.2